MFIGVCVGVVVVFFVVDGIFGFMCFVVFVFVVCGCGYFCEFFVVV